MQLAGNESSAVISAGSQRASVWLADTLSVRVRLYKREGGQGWKRGMLGDGAARGATLGPCRARRSRKIHRLPPPFSLRPRVLSREHSPPRHLLAVLVRGALFAVSPQLYRRPTLYVGLILRHPSSYAFFAPSSPSTANSLVLPCSIAFFYRILYSSCHSRVRRERFAFLHPVSSALHRWSGIKPAAIFTADWIYSRGWMRLWRPTDDRVNASSGIS